MCLKSLWGLCIALVSTQVELGHLQPSPGGSDSGGPETLALRFSVSEDRRESVDM